MKLTSITFTGIDERTDIDRIEKIQDKYPYVEWGVLMSYHWDENGHRYLNPKLLDKLWYRGLRLSAHFCGKMALDILGGETERMHAAIDYQFGLFKRCQLNVVATPYFRRLRTMRVFDLQLDEVILQMHSPSTLDSFLKYVGEPTKHVSYLIDGSCGRGIDCPIEVYDNPDIHIGYAGGIGPDNVRNKLKTLLEHPSYGECWIDMESRVRDEDDWLDLDKVEQVLEICDPLIQEHEARKERGIALGEEISTLRERLKADTGITDEKVNTKEED